MQGRHAAMSAASATATAAGTNGSAPALALPSKRDRQRLILEVIAGEPIGSQGELVARLNARGHAVTQATISRDIAELGLVKAPRRRGPRLRHPGVARERCGHDPRPRSRDAPVRRAAPADPRRHPGHDRPERADPPRHRLARAPRASSPRRSTSPRSPSRKARSRATTRSSSSSPTNRASSPGATASTPSVPAPRRLASHEEGRPRLLGRARYVRRRRLAPLEVPLRRRDPDGRRRRRLAPRGRRAAGDEGRRDAGLRGRRARSASFATSSGRTSRRTRCTRTPTRSRPRWPGR